MKLEALVYERTCGNRKLGEEVHLTVDCVPFARLEADGDTYRALAHEICETLNYDPTSNSRPPKAIRLDRGARHNQQRVETQEAIRSIIARFFERANDICTEFNHRPTWHPTADSALRSAAKLYQLWGYVDGLIAGKGEGRLSEDEISAYRKEWNDKCDQAFGDRVGEILKLHE